MLANDGTGDHLGPHLLSAGSGRHHSLTRSPFHSYLPLHAVPAQTSKIAGISLPLWRWTMLQWWFSNLHLSERNFKLTHYYLSSVASFSRKQAEKTNSEGRDYLAHMVLHMKTMKLWLTGSLSLTGLITHWKSNNHCCLFQCALLKLKSHRSETVFAHQMFCHRHGTESILFLTRQLSLLLLVQHRQWTLMCNCLKERIHPSLTTLDVNHWQVKWIALIVSLQCHVLLWNHPRGCYFDKYNHTYSTLPHRNGISWWLVYVNEHPFQ